MRYKMLEELAAKYGVANLRFFIPMQRIQGLAHLGLPIGIVSSDTPEERVECVVDERRYKVADGYKIELRAVADQDPDRYFGSKSYYQMDFTHLMERSPDDFQIYVLVDDPAIYRRIEQEELNG